MRAKPFVALAALVLLSACNTVPQNYSWGSYEESLYSYYRDNNRSEDYMMALASVCEPASDEALDRQATRLKKRIGPGLYAEYGFALMEHQRYAEAIHQFETEKRIWPESTAFMDTLIQLAKNDGLKDKSKPILTPQDTGKPAGPTASGDQKKGSKS